MKPLSFRNMGSIFLSALLITSVFVLANSVVSSASTGSDEVAATSGSNRFAVWSDSTPGNYEIFFRRSTDNGATWQATKNLSNNPGGSLNPEMAVSGSNVYMVWLQASADGTLADIFFRRSTDNGATWKSFVKITSIGTVGTSTPQVIISGTNVYVVWEQENGELYFRRSTDNGATWKPIINISNNPGRSINEEIAVFGSNVYVMWHQQSADGTKSDIFFRRSTDNGGTWKPNVNLSNFGSVSEFAQIAVSGPYLHVVWFQRDPTSNYIQIFTRRSIDNGATWKSSENISDSSRQSYFPRIDTAGSNVYVLYEEIVDQTDRSPTDLIFLTSRDNGATWKPAVRLVEGIHYLDYHILPQLLALGSNIYVVWTTGGVNSADLHFRGSTDNGHSWGPISGDLNNNTAPPWDLQIAASGSSVYLVWDNTWPREVYFLRSINNGATWEIAKNLSNNSGVSRAPQIAA